MKDHIHHLKPANSKHPTQVARNTVRVLKEKGVGSSSPLEMESFCMSFAMDCIARAVFSIDLNCAENPGNEFLRMGEAFVEGWRVALAMAAPAVAHWLRISPWNPRSKAYFQGVAAKMMRERRAEGTRDRYGSKCPLGFEWSRYTDKRMI